MDDLLKCETNYVPVTPLTFLKRAASAYADRTSVVHMSGCFTWHQTHERCLRLASSLRSLNVIQNDVVSILAPNIPAMYEMHFAVPMAGAVLNTINTRLNANNIATILRHSGAKVFFIDYKHMPVAHKALTMLSATGYYLPSSSTLATLTRRLVFELAIWNIRISFGRVIGPMSPRSFEMSGIPSHSITLLGRHWSRKEWCTATKEPTSAPSA
ncbi:hypothetical protein NL676_028181 [Syzygium grande]|nr:hypothetical protein NL676_028181 [Syzygium grande]